MGFQYLVRYGAMSRVAPFAADSDSYTRGQTVVIASRRGSELGEILAPAPAHAPAPSTSKILRSAGAGDLARAVEVGRERGPRLDACERVFRDGIWPLELIDVEPLLDARRTVLHYLGPHHLDADGLHAHFRDACGLDIVLEPAGIDPEDSQGSAPEHGCGSCGSEAGGCESSGGSKGGGCTGCSISALASTRRPVSPGV